tara:strand:+ start:6257 stop:6628 length:372 start_codon:yes stop_codon:yes gene_type:complete
MKISNRWIIVNDYETKCKLGIYPKELNRAQRVIINVRLEVLPKIHNDNINKVLSYEKIINIINDITTDNHKYLAETVSEEIAKKCLKLKNTISAHVILKKPDIIKGKTIVGVETFLKNNKQKY